MRGNFISLGKPHNCESGYMLLGTIHYMTMTKLENMYRVDLSFLLGKEDMCISYKTKEAAQSFMDSVISASNIANLEDELKEKK
jgi:hypothetical protein